MTVERIYVPDLGNRNPYYRIWAGEEVALSQVMASNAGYKISVDQKVREGEIAGQYVFDENLKTDLILSLIEPAEEMCRDEVEVYQPPIYQPRLFL